MKIINTENVNDEKKILDKNDISKEKDISKKDNSIYLLHGLIKVKSKIAKSIVTSFGVLVFIIICILFIKSSNLTDLRYETERINRKCNPVETHILSEEEQKDKILVNSINAVLTECKQERIDYLKEHKRLSDFAIIGFYMFIAFLFFFL